MSVKLPLLARVLDTPAPEQNLVSTSIRSALLSTLFDNVRPLFMAGVASAFVACIALLRLHQSWAAIWFAVDLAVMGARLLVIRAYLERSRSNLNHPGPWAAVYSPLCLLATTSLGLGTMACVISADRELAALAIMVTAGILGGIASRNAALPRLAISQISLGALPIGLGALLAPRSGSWIFLPPLVVYLSAMFPERRRRPEHSARIAG